MGEKYSLTAQMLMVSVHSFMEGRFSEQDSLEQLSQEGESVAAMIV